MLERVQASDFHSSVSNGKTRPIHLWCEKIDGDVVEVIGKYSKGCEWGAVNLVRELIGACLAVDLGLPVPTPYLIDFSKQFIDIIPNPYYKNVLAESISVGFGSSFITGQYTTWVNSMNISDNQLASALAIFCFDAIIQNPDRKLGNANLVVSGDKLRIFDHELCFAHNQILCWKEPWALGGLEILKTPGSHIFWNGLNGRKLDFEPIKASWKSLTQQHYQSYERAIPTEWQPHVGASVNEALALVKGACDNIDGCIEEIRRVLR